MFSCCRGGNRVLGASNLADCTGKTCSGRGYCRGGVCHCIDDYTGADCQKAPVNRYVTFGEGSSYRMGLCTCPDGNLYRVGENGSGSLQCEGGLQGKIVTNYRHNWGAYKVTCAPPGPQFDFDAAVPGMIGQDYVCPKTSCPGGCCLPATEAFQTCRSDPTCKYVEMKTNANPAGTMRLRTGVRSPNAEWSSHAKKLTAKFEKNGWRCAGVDRFDPEPFILHGVPSASACFALCTAKRGVGNCPRVSYSNEDNGAYINACMFSMSPDKSCKPLNNSNGWSLYTLGKV